MDVPNVTWLYPAPSCPLLVTHPARAVVTSINTDVGRTIAEHDLSILDSDEALAEHLAAINGAGDEVTLKKVFTAAYQAAGAAKDKEASKLFIKTKDARKKAITQDVAQ